jgi:hypothetical protein
MRIYFSLLFSLLFQIGFSQNQANFTLIPSNESGVTFKNEVPVYEHMNVLISQYHYNGGGVAIGDVNNDGLSDIFLVRNFGPDKLYLNKGNFQFEDISKAAKVEGFRVWETGVTMVDINNDGWLDIYVCRSGLAPNTSYPNLLYINKGLSKDADGREIVTFSEESILMGLYDDSHSTDAAFFDYDKDGDLDLYLLNHNVNRIFQFDPEHQPLFRNSTVGDILFRNDDGFFTDVSKEAGIIGKEISYGLGVMTGDLNQDGWTDIYVCNDFGERDYLYYNNGDGTFKEALQTSVPHVPYFSMGGDIGDINNDGWMDLMTLDMTAEDNFKQKANMNDMNPEKFQFLVDNNMHYQYMVNCLQLNNGSVNSNKEATFSDIAMLSGMAYTDWSWAPLMADFNNDGWKDFFISNGYRVDISNKDYVNWYKQREQELNALVPSQRNFAKEFQEAFSKITSEKVPNYLFLNNGDLTFENATEKWGLDAPSFSNGVAYGDLDNDGDLDLVSNNIDQEAFIYKNNLNETQKSNYLRIKLKGSAKNILGLGTRLRIKTGDEKQYLDFYMNRGFQSSVEPFAHFGLGKNTQVDELLVQWPDGKQELLTNIKANQVLNLDYANAQAPFTEFLKLPQQSILSEQSQAKGIDYIHKENEYDDFEKEVLLPHKLSQFGPALAVGDIQKDGLDDFFVGAAIGSTPAIFVQKPDGTFEKMVTNAFDNSIDSEDMDALFFDVEGDGDFDLYVVSGGNEYDAEDANYQDRIYLNDGKGNFKEANILPEIKTSGGKVSAADFDKDGDLDLFIGGRLLPRQYPYAPKSYLLENQNGKFIDVTAQKGKDLSEVGMVTDAIWTDIDRDKDLDLIVVGEWMRPSIFLNNKGKLTLKKSDAALERGWWFHIQEGDPNKDGIPDYFLGNLGLNYKYQASQKYPFEIYADDLDKNGSSDIILGYYNDEKLYPVRGRQCSSEQIPQLKDKFPTYNEFASQGLMDVYADLGIKEALHYKASNFASGWLMQNKQGSFSFKALPNEAQIAPITTAIMDDFDADKKQDLLLAGNLYHSEVETPRADAGKGLLLKGNDKGAYQKIAASTSGFVATGDIKKMKPILLVGDKKAILVAENNGKLQLWTY